MSQDGIERMPQVAAFLETWTSGRTRDGIPLADVWVRSLPYDLYTKSFAAELIYGDVMVNYTGTDLIRMFGRDNTGQGMYTGFGEKRREEALPSLQRAVDQITGYAFVNAFRGKHQGQFVARGIMLPVQGRDGSRQLVGVVVSDEIGVRAADLHPIRTVVKWVDIGFGVPPQEPS